MSKAFTFKPNKTEAKSFELFFERSGGFSAFVRKMAQANGYKPLPSLAEVSKRCAKQNELDTKEFEGTIADGIE